VPLTLIYFRIWEANLIFSFKSVTPFQFPPRWKRKSTPSPLGEGRERGDNLLEILLMNRIFAISDIHGCYKPFYELVVNSIRLEKSDQLVLLGDYVDRGTESREVIDFILDLQLQEFNVKALAGNHEAMLLDSYHSTENIPLWLLNSGDSTLLSFGIRDIKDLEKRYAGFFKSLSFYLIIGNFIFVHAGLNDEIDDPFTDTHSMIWETRFSYNNPLLSGKTIIHGHRPKPLQYINKLISERSKVIPIDSGCVYGREGGYGFLSALEVNSMSLYSVPYE
jgi:serine/threonine protein phosphatase 1